MVASVFELQTLKNLSVTSGFGGGLRSFSRGLMKSYLFLKMRKVEFPYDPAIPLPDLYSKEWKA